ncbi:MAG: septum formation protein Maf [Clostridia bacterium]|nr:septum formation protein Maf [Clostridia bacterium]
MDFILASASPRRKEILEQLGLRFSVITADTDENSEITDPGALVEELSFRKAQAVAKKVGGDAVVIGADTVVSIGGEILGKPKDAADARRMLRLLSGQTHQVMTGVTVLYGKQRKTAHCVTDVTFAPMSDAEIADYIAGREPYDKAGGYAIQGKAAQYITGINGCYWNVVGFPVNLFCRMLKSLGIDGI